MLKYRLPRPLLCNTQHNHASALRLLLAATTPGAPASANVKDAAQCALFKLTELPPILVEM